ncbi:MULTISPECIES: hypothetical protein [unclassified Paenibacillus]|uniref:hypothetical protein n=1 Tax=unclassified Paenibacillus TaxID=185978 RepID=UPI001AE9F131|nr:MULTISPECIES: hypothetical protein [unclassified Paenibacillus]MBP1156403.1 cytochrome P450 [Paenibacillus sp. PvP091]MBP1168211.1 cytochrome P450 [Paenibacillus sp. PvR098]MBP2439239.1 cytochrome P450 [Paenibacillus sp. PvP052]
MFTLFLPTKTLNMTEELQRIAEEWNAVVQQVPEGYILLPEYMMRIHGIQIAEEPGGWRFERDANATTWEDFLLMHITHRLAANYGLLLEFEWKGTMRFIEPTPHEFHTFDAYAEKVLAKEEGLVRDMKKNWIYAHRTRYVR